MISIKRSNGTDPDFIDLVKKLDALLHELDGEDHAFYAQFNKTNLLQHTVICYDDIIPIGCGAIKEYSGSTMEIKRMFVLPEYRSKGIATAILRELESWIVELNYFNSILETGKKQIDAIALYKKNKYKIIPNYGQYENIEDSICFEKNLIDR